MQPAIARRGVWVYTPPSSFLGVQHNPNLVAKNPQGGRDFKNRARIMHLNDMTSRSRNR